MQLQSSSHSVETSQARSAGNIKLGKTRAGVGTGGGDDGAHGEELARDGYAELGAAALPATIEKVMAEVLPRRGTATETDPESGGHTAESG